MEDGKRSAHCDPTLLGHAEKEKARRSASERYDTIVTHRCKSQVRSILVLHRVAISVTQELNRASLRNAGIVPQTCEIPYVKPVDRAADYENITVWGKLVHHPSLIHTGVICCGLGGSEVWRILSGIGEGITVAFEGEVPAFRQGTADGLEAGFGETRDAS